jgi:hypothetical protein
MRYRYNPSCGCARCRAHGFMGPTILITVGVLFLLSQATQVGWMRFHNTWPALLIVIGLIKFLQYNAPATGHVPEGYLGAPMAQQPPAWQPQPPAQPWPQPVPPQPWQQRPPAPPQPSAQPEGTGTTDPGEGHNG